MFRIAEKRKAKILMAIFLSFVALSFKVNAQQQESYKLAPDDVISVSVFGEPDLSLKEARVSSSGTIALSLIGQLTVKGKTISEAEQLIKNKYLDGYLKKPDVTVTIVEYRQFYVNGEVNKPGGYSFREGMTIQRAITLAGGFTERASRSTVKLIKEDNSEISLEVGMNEKVGPGDVITVEESFF
ncbi:polysaccharide biosynthesis/export family protein [Alteromonas sp. RKMC-009]|uniref:polysaccharide biosynthesis/export family protein n=1 Tax=Alteromonas sp. RKMC-009 TaxID=2267264 RepID=UPI000E69ED4B|nr:polysaccharide biosynthesis/export family protein [Alteromonas sp. RKMC-009]AYA62821.1 polysaccharide export protein [Alteromonas sp. RKMC-009]